MDELKKVLEELQKAFAEFKKANDESLAEIRTKGHADPLLTEKVEKLNARITELDAMKQRLEAVETKANRPTGMTGGETVDVTKKQHAEAFFNFVRKGVETGLADLERKAMNITTPGDGGFAVPQQLDQTILNLALLSNVMRQVCGLVTVGTSDYKKLVNKHGAAGGWVGEDDARPATGTPSLAEITPYMGEIYAYPQVTQQSLDDIFFNVEAFLAQEIADVIAEMEEAAFTSGNGTKKPKGFLAYATASTADGTRAFGTLQYLATGVDGAFKTNTSSVNPADDLIDLIAALKPALLPGSVFMANRLTLASVRKFKDNDGAYIWQPSLVAGQPNLLLGYPTVTNESMPNVASGTLALAFGNFKRGYTIVDRIGSRMLRDPFTNKPYVGFYTTKRMGGMLADSEAIKLLKFAAS